MSLSDPDSLKTAVSSTIPPDNGSSLGAGQTLVAEKVPDLLGKPLRPSPSPLAGNERSISATTPNVSNNTHAFEKRFDPEGMILGEKGNGKPGRRDDDCASKRSKSSLRKSRKVKKSVARFEKNRENAIDWSPSGIWGVFKAKLKNPSHPSTTSQSALGETEGASGSTLGSYFRPQAKSANSSASVGRQYAGSQLGYDEDGQIIEPVEPVSLVVVESDLLDFVPLAKSDNGSASAANQDAHFTTYRTGVDDGGSSSAHPRNSHIHGGLVETGGQTDSEGKSWARRVADSIIGSARPRSGRQTAMDDGSSIRRENKPLWIQRTWIWEAIMERTVPAFKYFCDSSFPEASKEKSYRKEMHFTLRRGAISASSFYVIAWVLTVALMNRPFNVMSWAGYFASTAVFIFPLPFFVIFDFIRHRPTFYQWWLWLATWSFSIVVITDMHLCGFYTTHRNCGNKDFLGLFYWGLALPVLSLFSLGQKRGYHICGVLVWVTLICGLVLSQGSPALMYRNLVNFILFHAFLLMTSYLREKSDRQVFTLRTQLKLQYRATQAAQVAERKANALSKRFVSYIFHEVRVPLNTALLALQNLQGEEVFGHCDHEQTEMVEGLHGSLTMMEKVLNDVLSFNRMESGRFTQARKPFNFHKSVQIVFLSHRAQALAGNLYLESELDPEIDRLGGRFMGDEMRLRQVMSNFTSNALKFTTEGGIRVVTKLLFPRMESSAQTPSEEISEDDQGRHNSLGSSDKSSPFNFETPGGTQVQLNQLDKHSPSSESTGSEKFLGIGHQNTHSQNMKAAQPGQKAIIRVEVHDTGVGLHPRDVKDNKLFSPYTQTEIGRRQGGKGTGLGLALCQQIIKLMGGRLGVESQIGQGSCFWFEIALMIAPPEKAPPPGTERKSTGELPVVHSSDFAHSRRRSSFSPNQTLSAHLARLPERDCSPESHEDDPLNLPIRSGVPAENALDVIDAQVHNSMFAHMSGLGTSGGTLPSSSCNSNDLPIPETWRKDSAMSDATIAVPPMQTMQQMQKSSDRPINTSPVAAKTGGTTFVKCPEEDRLHCLVVDDDTMTRKLMSRMLQRLGHEVSQAENGSLALDMVRERHFGEKRQFDIMFLDNQMPVMSGVETARELRRIACPIFIVGATGNALKEDQDEYIEAGADQVLTKPLKQSEMQAMLDLAKQRAAGETQPRDNLPRLSQPQV
ncbi:hypothetical protein QFC21_005205 [Naganishia friedmannii]|uniref:Uncharacterized protein n=1 Tax=Naganishia friedmannii TaxID=89922 RepID=A0ACC2VAL4_9TREE|nr:hypothetical protein QFC21_005205 [Naganishia friedmannii]